MPVKICGDSAGQHQPRQRLPPGEAQRPRDFAIGQRDGAHAAERVQRDGNEGGLGDHHDFQRLADPQEEHQERDPAERRHLCDRDEQRTGIVLDERRKPHRAAEPEAEQRADQEALHHAQQADRDIAGQFAGGPQVDAARPGIRRAWAGSGAAASPWSRRPATVPAAPAARSTRRGRVPGADRGASRGRATVADINRP